MADTYDVIAKRVAARWALHADHEDLLQAALLAAWSHRDEPASHIGTWAREAVVDELRRLRGRPGTARHAAQHVPLEKVVDELASDVSPLLAPSVELGLDGRIGWMIDRLAEGYSKRYVAARLGVHPSRVSQLLSELRGHLTRTGAA